MTSALRKKILSLAIRGKLVPQDPSDEPAVVLLERIQTERAANESATPPRGRGRRSSSDNPPCPKRGKYAGSKTADIADPPFPIPASWAWCRLGNVIEAINGIAFKPTDWKETGLPIVRIQNLNDCSASFNCTERKVPDSVHLYGGELLFAWSGTPGTSFGAHIWQQREAVLNQHIFKLVFDEHLFDKRFLKLSLNHLVESLIAKAHGGVGLAHITRKVFDEILIPIPPFNEQRRIVDQYEQMSSLCEIVDKSYSDLHALSAILKARILDLAIRGELDTQDPEDEPASALLFRIRAATDKPPCPKREKNAGALGVSSSPFPIPESWEWTTLGEVCDYGRCETVDAAAVAGETWSLDLEDIEKGSGRLISRVRASERPASGTRHSFRAGHVLYSKLRTYLNKVLVADEDGVCSSEILPLDFRGLVQPGYARFVLMSSMFLDYAARCGYGVKMPRLGTADGRNGPFPLPPLAEQRRIVEKVEELFSAIDAMVTT